MRDDLEKDSKVLALVGGELIFARKKHPDNMVDENHFWGILDEEVTELKEAIISGDPKRILEEAIQVGAMAVRGISDLGLVEPGEGK